VLLHECPHGRNATVLFDVSGYVVHIISDRPLQFVPHRSDSDSAPIAECSLGDAQHRGYLFARQQLNHFHRSHPLAVLDRTGYELRSIAIADQARSNRAFPSFEHHLESTIHYVRTSSRIVLRLNRAFPSFEHHLKSIVDSDRTPFSDRALIESRCVALKSGFQTAKMSAVLGELERHEERFFVELHCDGQKQVQLPPKRRSPMCR